MKPRPNVSLLFFWAYGWMTVGGCAKDIVKEPTYATPTIEERGGAEELSSAQAAVSLDAAAVDTHLVAIVDSGTRVIDAEARDSALPRGGSGASERSDAALTPADGASIDSGSIDSASVDNGCSLTGRWIATQRTLNEALGGLVIQSGHSWIYYEFEQRGERAVITRALQCGEEVKDHSASPAFATQVTSSQALWNGIALHNPTPEAQVDYLPQPGSDQCQLHLHKNAVVRGATYSHFGAFSGETFVHPLDQAMTTAQGSTPGCEDWDEDGNPGVTYHISGIASGDMYMVQRDLLEYTGTTERHAVKFKLAVARLHEQRVVAQNPATIPSAEVTPSADPAEHFIWFARVDGWAAWELGTDADAISICAKLRLAKDQLIPEGNQ